MRSHTNARWHAATMTMLLIVALSIHAAPVEQESPQREAQQPGRAEIARALDVVKSDPNLATDRTIKTLRWRGAADAKPSPMPAWLIWIAGLFHWFEQSARVLVWCAAAVLAGMLVVFITRMLRTHGLPQRDEAFVAPTHVRDLDIRPESLPRDIGTAARLSWDRGEQRAALALLYRGMLSRLAHVHRVPIRDSSTEGDCLVLVVRFLAQGKCEYASRLVRVWQRAVYGRENIPAETVYVLCDDFGSVLDEPRPGSVVSRGAA